MPAITPSADLRLASMMRAMSDVILPAVAGNSFATEQAMLMLGHLHVLRTQLDHLPRYEQMVLEKSRAFARALCDNCPNDVAIRNAADRLAEAAARPAETPQAVRDLHETIGAATEDFILAAMQAKDSLWSKSVLDRAIAHGASMADADRSWFAAIGFEAAGTQLPSLDALLSGQKA